MTPGTKLALGTVQFGLEYGIANTRGRVSDAGLAGILAAARKAGVALLDTAIAYGDSEARLGEVGIAGFDLVTKVPALAASGDVVSVSGMIDRVETLVRASLARLRRDSLYGVLLHRSADLSGPAGGAVATALGALKAKGLAGRIGVSIYDPAELDGIMRDHEIDIVQVPYNVFDRRIDSSGWLDVLKRRGVEVHARSAFLQGLLLMPKARRPEYFAPWARCFDAWEFWLSRTGRPPLAAALAVPLSDRRVDRVVVGVDDEAHLADIIAAAGEAAESPPATLASNDPDLVNPANWKIS